MSFSSDGEEDGELFVPEQIDEETLRLKLLREEQDAILVRYEQELSGFREAQDQMEQLKKEKQQQLRLEQAQVQVMQQQINIVKTSKCNLLFEYERHAMHDMGKMWYLTIIPLYLFMLHFYYKGLYFLVFLNTAGLLAHWRMLYVLHAEHTQVFGIAILLVSWFLGTSK